jgi:glycosyltransferase involved in cell wall biosynthesis
MRIVALLATYNESRFIGQCLEHLHSHGLETYVIDNASEDDTVAIAETFRDSGLIGIEQLPRDGVYEWTKILQRKEELSRELKGDWFMHVDADELRLPPPGHDTLSSAFATADQAGYNAVNFLEFTFLPTRESPEHDHPDFQRTLRTYYPFLPRFPHRLNAWKSSWWRRPDLHTNGGHRVRFRGLKMYPESFFMKHYILLSPGHALEKYGARKYSEEEVARGWHGFRARMNDFHLELPSESAMRVSAEDSDLDPSQPRRRHMIDPATLRSSESVEPQP